MSDVPSPARSRFLAAAVAAAAASFAAPSSIFGAGARPGPWCRELTKFAREHTYDFNLDLLDDSDQVFEMSAYRGKVLWLNFFTSWCPPCNAEAADIVRIANKYGSQLSVVGISVKERPEPVRSFRERHHITYKIALDDKGIVFSALGFQAYPTHMFIDAKGTVSCISVGDLLPEQMDNEVAVALARAPLTPATATSPVAESTPRPSGQPSESSTGPSAMR
jgi:thiol-disulfide isomerase/thioredoxin